MDTEAVSCISIQMELYADQGVAVLEVKDHKILQEMVKVSHY